jgi:hypothetical protein
MPIEEENAPEVPFEEPLGDYYSTWDDDSTVQRLTIENTWLKSVAKKMVKRAHKDTGRVIMGKEDDHAIISEGHFMAVVDGTFLEWFLGLEDCDTVPPIEAGSSVDKSIKEWFDELDVGQAFAWTMSSADMLEEKNIRGVIEEAIGGTQVSLVLSVFGFAAGNGSDLNACYTTWPFVHVIMQPTRKKDPHLVAGYDRTKFLFIQQDLVRIFGDSYGSLKYTVNSDLFEQLQEGKDARLPICVWSPEDKLMGLVSRMDINLKTDSRMRWWQGHLR